MSLLAINAYKGEDGVQHNPKVLLTDQNTHALVDGVWVKKTVREVLIKWNAGTSTWVIQTVWSAGTLVAIETTNPADNSKAFFDLPINDYLAAQCCLIIEEA